MNVKNVIKRLFKGNEENIVMKDEHGLPVRKATPDDIELEQYQELDRRKKVKEFLALKRRERFTQEMTYGGIQLNIPQPKLLPIEKTMKTPIKKSHIIKTKKSKILNSGRLFFGK